MKVVSLECPGCGATVEIRDGQQQAVCEYCGTKVFIEGMNTTAERRKSEAEVIQAETDRMVRMRQMEIAEKARAEHRRIRLLKIVVALIMTVTGIVMMVEGFSQAETPDNPNAGFGLAYGGLFLLLGACWVGITLLLPNEENIQDGKIKVPSTISDYEGKNYAVIAAAFRDAGFKDIRCVPLGDLVFGLFKKPGTVDSIIINGEKTTSGRYFPDVKIMISYHSKK